MTSNTLQPAIVKTSRPATPPPSRPRPTAQERQANRERARLEAAENKRLADEEFERNKPARWETLYGLVTKLALLVQAESGFAEEHSWLMSDFQVDVLNESFTLNDVNRERDRNMPVSLATVTADIYQRAKSNIDEAHERFRAYRATKDAERQASADLAARQNAALAKLTPEEIKILSLPAKYFPKIL